MTTETEQNREQPVTAYARFEEIYQAEASAVLRYARYRVGVDQAEDIVADTFALAWQRLDRIPDLPRPWLLATARRLSANHLRTRKREQERRGRLSEFLADPLTSDMPAVVDDRQDLMTAIRNLSPLDREALLLVTWCDLTNNEAAGVMETSVTAFNVRLHRARRRLRQSMRHAHFSPRHEEISHE